MSTRPSWFFVFAAMVGCAPAASTTPPPKTVAQPAAPTWKTRAVDGKCQTELGALIAGRLDGFRGLGKCGRVDAEQALGSSGEQPSKFEQFGEYRVYPRPDGTILVWFLSDDIRVMQRLFPKLQRPIKSQLGEPEAKTPSGLSVEWEQWVYASRGLTAHVKRQGGEVVALFAYRATTVDAFLASDIAKVSKSDAPLEELK